jgi:ATP-dependent RNA helicase DDX23/PRP28
VVLWWQVLGVMEAMPSSNLKPEADDSVLEEDKVYRTTYMFSATMPPAVERIARKYLRRPVVVQIGSVGRATLNVTQEVKMLQGKSPDAQKIAAIEEYLYQVGLTVHSPLLFAS